MKLVTAAKMQELDRRAINEWGIPGVVLMENAGRRTFELMVERFKLGADTPVLVLAGRGNNGGDGFVITRHLRNRNIPVRVALLSDPSGLKGDALVNYQIVVRMGIPVVTIPDAAGLNQLADELKNAAVAVDAIFGTGLNSPVRGHYAEAIKLLNTARLKVVAVDIPSGLDSDTGKILEVAVRADLTVTYGFAKVGQMVYPGAELVGELIVADISLPADLWAATAFTYTALEPEDLKGLLSQRTPEAHKGRFGHLLILAGSPGKTGAAALAGIAAQKSGAGLVTVGVPRELNPILEVKLTEVMTVPLPQDAAGLFAFEALAEMLKLAADKQALALGPGLGRSPELTRLVAELIRKIKVPLVIDADGLNAVAEDVSVLKQKAAPIVLTPHPGEMARLSGKTNKAVQADRIGCAQALAEQYGVIVVLKGARTIVAEPNGQIGINLSGNPGMASGGMGDVLTGLIGGFLAQGLEPGRAGALGTYLHGRAGDLAAITQGEAPLIAGDLLATLPQAMREIY